MAEETIDETQDSNLGEDTVQEQQTESTEVDVEALQAENARLEKVAKQQQERAYKAEQQLKKAKEPQSESINQISDEKYERLDLKTDGYKSEEVDLIMELGGVKVINNPVVKEAIANLRKKSKSQEATPSGTAKSPVYQKFTEQDLKRMPLAELEKIIPQD